MSATTDVEVFLQKKVNLTAEEFQADSGVWEICVHTPETWSQSPERVEIEEAYGSGTLLGLALIKNPLERKAIAIVSAESVRKLNGQAPGGKHLSTFWGSQVWDALSSRKELLFGNKLRLSLEALFSLGQDFSLSDFLVGFAMRSVSPLLSEKAGKRSDGTLDVAVCARDKEGVERAVCEAEALLQGVLVARSLVNAPPNLLTPRRYEEAVDKLVDRIRKQAEGRGLRIEHQVYKGADLDELGCRLIQAVGQGSRSRPRLIKISSVPTQTHAASLKKVALVGKGITFDSGGYNLKPSGAMRLMKKDMGGSAAVLGGFTSAVLAGIPIALDCYIAVAENMVSGEAMRPGDLYRARNGDLVEIDNTDAEGRLVLADALHLAAESQPDLILDFATLTGAARVALGPEVDALFSNSPEHAQGLFADGIETGDWVWPLPLVESYGDMIESRIGDVVNSAASGLGGAITAALFLQRFVGEVPWAHIDTYMWADSANNMTSASAGPTGKCVRLIHSCLGRLASQS